MERLLVWGQEGEAVYRCLCLFTVFCPRNPTDFKEKLLSLHYLKKKSDNLNLGLQIVLIWDFIQAVIGVHYCLYLAFFIFNKQHG